jgi:hypothetical protein
MIEPTGHRVLDTRLRGYDDQWTNCFVRHDASFPPASQSRFGIIRNKSLLQMTGDCVSAGQL